MKAAQIVWPDPAAEASFVFGQGGQVWQDGEGHLFAIAESFEGAALALGEPFEVEVIPQNWFPVKHTLTDENQGR